MVMSVYDLQCLYINRNYTSIEKEERIKILACIKGALKNGATCSQIFNRIMGLDKANQNYREVFSGFRKLSNGNLLDPTRFYYHNELRITPKAPLRAINFEDDAIFVAPKNGEKQDNFYLEMKCSYTIDDLFSYLKKKDHLKRACENESKAIGGLKYLLSKYDIEIILFMIDTANNILSLNDSYLNNVLAIADYKDKAEENYISRKTEASINGDNKIVYKKRILFEN